MTFPFLNKDCVSIVFSENEPVLPLIDIDNDSFLIHNELTLETPTSNEPTPEISQIPVTLTLPSAETINPTPTKATELTKRPYRKTKQPITS